MRRVVQLAKIWFSLASAGRSSDDPLAVWPCFATVLSERIVTERSELQVFRRLASALVDGLEWPAGFCIANNMQTGQRYPAALLRLFAV